MFTSRNIAVEDVAAHQLHFPSLHLNCLTNSQRVIRQNSGLRKVFTLLVFSLHLSLFILCTACSSRLPPRCLFRSLISSPSVFFYINFSWCDSSEVRPSACSFWGPCRIDVQAGRAGIRLQPRSLMYSSVLSPGLKSTWKCVVLLIPGSDSSSNVLKFTKRKLRYTSLRELILWIFTETKLLCILETKRIKKFWNAQLVDKIQKWIIG